MRRRPLLRAAVVGGGAYVAGKRRAERSAIQQQETGPDRRLSNLEGAQPSQPGGGQATAAGGQPMGDQLRQISALHQQGVLTDEEFAAAKAKLLGM